ncbi:Retrovirus-related Pol polyprotein from transposon TNT 1-94 [Senna tora]|uniref:Retrovirus-related Pol polyprotein from transposon TNT 1-94 n=1 Tax=Senna tora TaxID=362788 RepID=A0A834SE98_9FABA|nr:Retrovirus-related Pol polyprotein from transposon TNT 1-94 [Senna tora]
MPDSKVVEKILVTLPERFEAKISALEEICDLIEITLAELLNALHAQEQRSKSGAVGNKETNYPPCQHCGRTNHPHFRCWSRPDVKCNKCNQMGHIEKICKNKNNQQVNEAKRDKLGKKSEIGIFIGYSMHSKAYRIYKHQAKKIVISRDVVFMEEDHWD